MKKILISLSFLFSVVLINAQSAAPEAATDGTLTVTATVSSSTYIYAVWINTGTTTFLRTLTKYSGNNYVSDLVNWVSASGKNVVNATTGATKPSAATIVSTWNGKDQANTALVADGTFTVKIEMTNESYGSSSKLVTASFTKGTSTQTVTPSNVSPITNISIKWVPLNTAVQNTELSNRYTIYPSPAVSTIYVNGFDIEEIHICSLNAQCLITSKEQRINIGALPKGVYLANIITKNGNVVKKFVKE